jgi:hypothetical protein
LFCFCQAVVSVEAVQGACCTVNGLHVFAGTSVASWADTNCTVAEAENQRRVSGSC